MTQSIPEKNIRYCNLCLKTYTSTTSKRLVLTSLTRPDQLRKTKITVNGNKYNIPGRFRGNTFSDVHQGKERSIEIGQSLMYNPFWKRVHIIHSNIIFFRSKPMCLTNRLGGDLRCRPGLSVIRTDIGLTVTSDANPTI